MNKNFFSISFDLVILGMPIPYDLHINSSTNILKVKYVRIFPKGDLLTGEELEDFKKKYLQLYVHESQREDYLKSLVYCVKITDVIKTNLIKDSAIHYLDRLFDKDKKFSTEMLEETIRGCKTAVESMVNIVKDYKMSEVQNLIANLSYHDFYTYDHSINVAMYCIALYTEANPLAPKEKMVLAGLGGLLHDIGKVNIPTDIINNPNILNDEEFELMKKHPQDGYNLLLTNGCKCAGVDFEIIKKVVYEHHENFNGSGYPNFLEGLEIDYYARLTAIVDFFDAITTKRAYYQVLSVPEAIEVMSNSTGKKLDPTLFGIFATSINRINMMKKIEKELPDDFDPCKPHNVLPFIKVEKKNYKISKFGSKNKNLDFGKIKKKVNQ